jgi:hypothetical protein
VAFYRGTLTAQASTPALARAAAATPARRQETQPADPVSLPATTAPQTLLPDPWVPPALRPQAPPPPSQGKALQTEIEGRVRALRQHGGDLRLPADKMK